MRPLLPHQDRMMEYAVKHAYAGLLCDKRIGKTTVAYRWALAHGARYVLVVAPKSAIPGWIDEIEADGGLAWDMTNRHNMETWLAEGGRLPGVIVINPQGLFRAGRGEQPKPYPIAMYEWDAVIWDEIVNIKHPATDGGRKGQINAVAHACLGDVPLRCGLSGEYAPEGALDVFEPMRWIFGSFMGHTNFWKWRFEHFEQVGYEFFPKKGVLGEIKRIVGERAFVLSRKDAGMGESKTFAKSVCDLPKPLRKAYDHAETYFEVPAALAADDPAGRWRSGVAASGRGIRYTNYVPVVRSWLLQIAGGRPKGLEDLHSDHKMVVLMELLQGEHERDPVVVSFRFNDEMHAAHDLLQKKGIPSAKIWGDLTVDKRRAVGQAFRDGKVRVILKQAAVHYGMDLSTADTMIRFSLPEAYNDISQDADRIIHPQKKRPLLYRDLICRNTVDEDVFQAGGDKHLVARFFMERRKRVNL